MKRFLRTGWGVVFVTIIMGFCAVAVITAACHGNNCWSTPSAPAWTQVEDRPDGAPCWYFEGWDSHVVCGEPK